MVSVIISLTAMMYIFQIPAVIMLRKKYPDHPRPFRVPGGRFFLWLCVIGAEAIVIITDHHAAVARPARQRAGPALRHRLLVGSVPRVLRDRDAGHRRRSSCSWRSCSGPSASATSTKGLDRRERPAGGRPRGRRSGRGPAAAPAAADCRSPRRPERWRASRRAAGGRRRGGRTAAPASGAPAVRLRRPLPRRGGAGAAARRHPAAPRDDGHALRVAQGARDPEEGRREGGRGL